MPLRDVIDVSFAMADEEIELLVEHADETQECIAFDKDYDEELGVEFRKRRIRRDSCMCDPAISALSI